MQVEFALRRTALAPALCLVAALSACATNSTRVDKRASGAVDIAKAWQTALAGQDFDAALRLVAEDFSSDAWPQKADLAYYFQQAQQRDYFARATVPDETVQVMIDGDEAVIYPVTIRAKLGVAVYLLTIQNRDDQWRIVSAVQELY